MPTTRVLLAASLAASLTLLAACGGKDDDSEVKVSFDTAKTAAAAAEPLGPGDARVTSTDGSFVLSLVGDSVRMQLSDSLRSKVEREIDTSAKDGLGGIITRSVSGIVGSALGFVVRIPVTEIENIRYEDGEIRFGTRGKANFEIASKRGDARSSAKFAQPDAERFVAAVKARQAELATAR